jgi:hypothetical protein
MGSTAGMTEKFKSANLAEAIGMLDIQVASGIGMARTFGIAAAKVGARVVLSEGEVYRPINLASPH